MSKVEAASSTSGVGERPPGHFRNVVVERQIGMFGMGQQRARHVAPHAIIAHIASESISVGMVKI